MTWREQHLTWAKTLMMTAVESKHKHSKIESLTKTNDVSELGQLSNDVKPKTLHVLQTFISFHILHSSAVDVQAAALTFCSNVCFRSIVIALLILSAAPLTYNKRTNFVHTVYCLGRPLQRGKSQNTKTNEKNGIVDTRKKRQA